MPIQFEQRYLRLALVVIIFGIFALQIWFQFLNRESFAALAGANLLLVDKVQKFQEDVSWAVIQQELTSAIVLGRQAAQFEADTKNRVAHMDAWTASAAQTKLEVEDIQVQLYALSGRLEVLSKQILEDVDSARRSAAITRQQAVAAQEKLSHKIVTQPEADQLKKQDDQLKQQNKELKKKTQWKLF